MNLKQNLIVMRFSLILLLSFVSAIFSSCNPIKMKDQGLTSLTQQSLNSGDIYGGKQFVLPASTACTDGRAFKAVMVMNAAGVYSLVRDNCQLLQTPQDVPSTDIKPVTDSSIQYRGEIFKEQFSGSLPMYYLPEITAKWCRGKLSTLSPVGSTALIEFAEQGDGQFKGEVAWLDYSSGSYTYYASHEIKLFQENSVDPSGVIHISGMDLKIDPELKVNVSIGLGDNYSAALTVGDATANLKLECTGF
jgi:hypothetical protein